MSEIDIRTGDEEVIDTIRFADEDNDNSGATCICLDDDGDVSLSSDYIAPENISNLIKALQKAIEIWDGVK